MKTMFVLSRTIKCIANSKEFNWHIGTSAHWNIDFLAFKYQGKDHHARLQFIDGI